MFDLRVDKQQFVDVFHPRCSAEEEQHRSSSPSAHALMQLSHSAHAFLSLSRGDDNHLPPIRAFFSLLLRFNPESAPTTASGERRNMPTHLVPQWVQFVHGLELISEPHRYGHRTLFRHLWELCLLPGKPEVLFVKVKGAGKYEI